MRRLVFGTLLALAAIPAARAETLLAPPAEKPAWSTAVYLDGYYQRDASAFMVPTLFADRGPLHLEARYNYEDFDTTSLWAGWGFTFGNEGRYAKLVPMLGGVFGTVNGMAPGLEIEAKWGRFSYWLEAEYVLDFQDSAGHFLSAWSEGYYSIQPWLWAGASVQRLRVVDSPREVDVGPMIGVGKPGAPGWSVSVYAYGLTSGTPLWLATAAAQF
jgi:hypothetical protein